MKRKTFKFFVTKAKPFLKKGGSYVAAAVAGEALGDIAVAKGKAWLDKRKANKRFEIYNNSPRFKRDSARVQRKLQRGISKIYSKGIKKK